MASAFSHAIAALSIAACFSRPGVPKRCWIAGALCAVAPDLDVIGFGFGIQYGDLLGHRGLTHSVAFAATLAALVTFTVFRESVPGLSRRALFAYLFLATASHGFLDAMTDGGLGVAFFAPFSNARYFLPWTPIRVSPIGVSRFFTDRALAVLKSEVVWIWMPASLLALVGWGVRKRAAT
ncbi:MAG TPA: metal-dependent hydrolase [Gemmatimonadales bacterium]|nr:metal-dependent hydrolase [Gemmatimonadales bacterium]